MIRLVIKVIAAQVIRALDDVSGFRDTYMDALEELIEAKAEGKTPAAPKTERKGGGQVVDLMSALEQSVQKAKESRGESGEDATVHDMPSRKKTTSKKTAKKAPGQEDGREEDVRSQAPHGVARRTNGARRSPFPAQHFVRLASSVSRNTVCRRFPEAVGDQSRRGHRRRTKARTGRGRH
ncbi:hypothetical protein [Streptomyces niveus]|uniref:hypothetical protein n=1 Tax=Streptomyces niveus TaxID=193462 RepID=UPI003416C01C